MRHFEPLLLRIVYVVWLLDSCIPLRVTGTNVKDKEYPFEIFTRATSGSSLVDNKWSLYTSVGAVMTLLEITPKFGDDCVY